MKRKYIYISIAVILAVVLIVILMVFSKKSHTWDMTKSPTETGDEPYDITLVDQLLKRSLPNGYEVREASIVRGQEYDEEAPVDVIASMPTDTSLLVIQQYGWKGDKKEFHHYYGSEDGYEAHSAYNITVMKELFDFCQRGGKALYVPTSNLEYVGVTSHFKDLYSIDDYNFIGEDDLSLYDTYSREWLKARPDTSISLKYGDKDIKLSNRYAVNRYIFNAQRLNNNRLSMSVPRITTIIYDPETYGVYAFAWEFSNGGRLYVCSLGLHFTNLGVTLDDERFVMEEMIGKIDSQPVVRVTYPRLSSEEILRHYHESEVASGSRHFSVINDNPSLRLAWILILVFAGCFIFSGLWRRRPVAKAIDIDDLDRTDFVAVREYQFRKSPLLHFLFQTSWLYNPVTDHRQLFQTNYRRVARYVARISNINLANAKDSEFREVAQTLSKIQGRDEQEIYDELKWMAEWALRVDRTSPQQFAKSQRIAENYPL